MQGERRGGHGGRSYEVLGLRIEKDHDIKKAYSTMLFSLPSSNPHFTCSFYIDPTDIEVVAAHIKDPSSVITKKGFNVSKCLIYLDTSSMTQIDVHVLGAMGPYSTKKIWKCVFHNTPLRLGGRHCHRVLVGSLNSSWSKEIIFTSGATEANNIAIKGVIGFHDHFKNHIITSATELPSVLESCRHMERMGFEVTYHPVNSNGIIDLDELWSNIRSDTGLVSVMAVNNDTGVIQPVGLVFDTKRERESVSLPKLDV